MINDKYRRLKIVLTIIITFFLSFTYNSFFYEVQAEEESSSDSILQSQSESLRHIEFYRRSK